MWSDERIDALETKVDEGFKEMREEFKDVRAEMHAGFAQLRTEMEGGFRQIHRDLFYGAIALYGTLVGIVGVLVVKSV